MKEIATLEGIVVSGNHIGSGMGVPTANLVVPPEHRNLPHGVYYSRTVIFGKEYKSITNLGKKPTIKTDDTVNAETFILDFDGDLYSQTIKVILLKFRREEQKFDSLEKLFETIKEDIKAGREYIDKQI